MRDTGADDTRLPGPHTERPDARLGWDVRRGSPLSTGRLRFGIMRQDGAAPRGP